MKPILFNTEMVRAIMDGRKTMTRRVIRPQPPATACIYNRCGSLSWPFWLDGDKHVLRPPYHYGDDLYVRETWQEVFETESDENVSEHSVNIRNRIINFDSIPKIDAGISQEHACATMPPRMKYYVFKASGIEYANPQIKLTWRPAIHMPRKAARIFLRVTGMHIERLQDITAAECIHEGIPRESLAKVGEEFTIGRFSGLWDSTVKKADRQIYGWDANPWVWAIKFEQISKEE